MENIQQVSSNKDISTMWDALEQEQEYIVNKLRRQLDLLRKEKAEQFQALEAEQEFIVNRLQKQLEAVRLQQANLPGGASAIATGSSAPINSATPSAHSRESSAGSNRDVAAFRAGLADISLANSVLDTLRQENGNLRSKLLETEREFLAKAQQASKYRKELVELRTRLNIPVDDLLADTTPLLLPIRSNSKDRSSRRVSAKIQTTLPGTSRQVSSTGTLVRSTSSSSQSHPPIKSARESSTIDINMASLTSKSVPAPISAPPLSNPTGIALTNESGDERMKSSTSAVSLSPISPMHLNQ